MVSLLQLSAELGSNLVPADGGRAASRQLSGVHVSELEDPTPYLEGGELLLTTGMPLTTGVHMNSGADAEAYVRRLRDRGVPALGLGLGPSVAQVPEGLARACRTFDVDLLVVPDGVPFQSVSRAFWRLNERSGKADLMSSLGTQTALARAAMRLDATAAVVRGLAQELNGWAAYLPGGEAEAGEAATYWPRSTEHLLPLLQAETLRLNRTGVHSAATFEVQGRPVVEYPIADGDRILGFLAVGPGRDLTAADRQIILTVCTLLAIKHRQRQTNLRVAKTFGAAVAKLLLTGQAEAARVLAEDAGLPDLPPRVRILGLRMNNHDVDRDSALRTAPMLPRSPGLPALPSTLVSTALRHEENDVVYLVLNETELGEQPGKPDQEGRRESSAVVGVLSEPVLLSEAANTWRVLRGVLSRAPAGALTGAVEQDHGRAEQWVQRLADHSGADLKGTVTAYLRHRGRWESAARELGLHRNSVRHRIGIAEALLGADLNDPDVFAPLWLALRGRCT